MSLTKSLIKLNLRVLAINKSSTLFWTNFFSKYLFKLIFIEMIYKMDIILALNIFRDIVSLKTT